MMKKYVLIVGSAPDIGLLISCDASQFGVSVQPGMGIIMGFMPIPSRK
jgi:hypothetical protein